jgi:hypothetical protein
MNPCILQTIIAISYPFIYPYLHTVVQPGCKYDTTVDKIQMANEQAILQERYSFATKIYTLTDYHKDAFQLLFSEAHILEAVLTMR